MNRSDRLMNLVKEAYNHMVGIYKKGNATYYLWNDGNYLYNLTTMVDGKSKYVQHWTNKDLEEIKDELESKGYKRSPMEGE